MSLMRPPFLRESDADEYSVMGVTKIISLPLLAATFILLAYIVGQSFVEILLASGRPAWTSRGSWTFPGVLALGAAVVYGIYKKYMPLEKEPARPGLWKTVLLGSCTLLVMLLASLAMTLLADGYVNIRAPVAIESVPVLIGVALLIPFIEEVACRAWLVTALEKIASVPVSIASSSLIFSLLHFSIDFHHLLTFFMLGVVLAWLWVRTRSLMACFLVHASYNLVVYLLG